MPAYLKQKAIENKLNYSANMSQEQLAGQNTQNNRYHVQGGNPIEGFAASGINISGRVSAIPKPDIAYSDMGRKS